MVKYIYIIQKGELLMYEVFKEKYDYQKELRKLLNKRFQDNLEAKIALARVRMHANVNGHRGQHKNLEVRAARIVFVNK